VNEFYALSKDASEDSLLDAAKAERQKLTDATEKVKILESEILEKEIELEKFKNESIKVAVNAAIESGKFDEKDKDSLIENALTIGLDKFNAMVSKIKIPHVDVTALIVEKTGAEKVEEKKFEDYSEPELVQLKATNPEKFEAIIKDFNERD